jgi:beta-lactamase superfamily II metal-dependent hydrolase
MRSTILPVLTALPLLLASPAMAGKPVCGDGSVKGGEQCDGADLNGYSCESLGYSGGTLACSVTCSFDTSGCTTTTASCGDGVVDGYEECDGADDAACPSACSDHCACPAVGAGDLEVHVIDVGQGEAILVVSPDGFVTLVDSGDQGRAPIIAGYMGALGITELDYTVVSHFHADHVASMDVVLASHPEVVACFDHGGSYTTTQYSEYDAAAGSRRVGVSPGYLIDMGPSMSAEVLSADVSASDENRRSVVLRLDYGATSILLGGDCEGGCEAGFDPGPIDIYKVHHHGSDDSSTASFLALAQPTDALISVGATNPYGHPQPNAMARLADVGATVWRTDVDGDLAVVVNGSGYTINDTAVCSEGETRSCGTTDIGACSLGLETCGGGAWGACEGAMEPVAEICDNGLDDDCDGATDDADADCATGAPGLLMVQVYYDTIGDDAIEEFVDLYNPTGADISLDGYTLTDNLDTWAFPSGYVVPAYDYVSVARDAAGFAALFGLEPEIEGLTLALGNTGDQLSLADSVGEVDFVAWEGQAGWTLSAPIGDGLERSDHGIDTDTQGDWFVSSPATPYGGVVSDCGNGVCDPGEDCTTCASDCVGKTGGKPTGRYCCGNGSCESVGEDATNCPVDCG